MWKSNRDNYIIVKIEQNNHVTVRKLNRYNHITAGIRLSNSNNVTVWKLNRNNQLKQFNTTVCKLFVLYWNTWYHITMCQQTKKSTHTNYLYYIEILDIICTCQQIKIKHTNYLYYIEILDIISLCANTHAHAHTHTQRTKYQVTTIQKWKYKHAMYAVPQPLGIK